jgi:isopenicillin-N N-acyltransferase-like protein
MSIRSVDLNGSANRIGHQLGLKLRASISDLIESRLERLVGVGPQQERDLDQAQEIARRVWDLQEQADPELTREMLGVAEGAEADPLDLLLLSGEEDFADLLQEHGSLRRGTSFWTGHDVCAEGVNYLGASWELEADLCAELATLRLYPDDGPATLLFGLGGCVGLAGLNEAGLAVLATKLLPTDTREGIVAAFLLRRALKQLTLEGAVRVLAEAARGTGQNYVVADAAGRAVNIEMTATQASVTLLTKGVYVHANHYLSARLKAFQRELPAEELLSSLTRYQRLRQLLTGAPAALNLAMLKGALADHENGVNALCYHADAAVPGAGAALIISPQEGKMWTTNQHPCAQRYQLFQL